MKQTHDISCFERILPQIYANANTQIFYADGKKSARKFPLPLGSKYKEPLFAEALFHGHFLPGYHYRRINAPSIAIEYVREGELAAKQDDRTFLLEAGEIFLMQPGHNNEIMVLPNSFCIKTSIVISGDLLPEILRILDLWNKDIIKVENTKLLGSLFQAFEEIAAKTDPFSQMRNGSLSYSLLQALRILPESEHVLPHDIEMLVKSLEENCDFQWTTAQMARQCKCSETWLIRRFRLAMGQTPHQLLLRFRMEKAAKLLLSQSDLSIKEISALCGYSDALNFSTAFRKSYGSSPLHYRKEKLF